MKSFSQKSQSAVEYLQTYSWAILLIVLLGVALWQLGIFSAGPQANVALGFKTLKVLEPSIRYACNPSPDIEAIERTANSINFTITNTGGKYVHIDSIKLSEDCKEYVGCLGGDCPCQDTLLQEYILGPGETTALAHSCCTSCLSLGPDDPFYIKVNITYWERIGEKKIAHKETGVLQGFIEHQ